jgi:hypothetical protein
MQANFRKVNKMKNYVITLLVIFTVHAQNRPVPMQRSELPSYLLIQQPAVPDNLLITTTNHAQIMAQVKMLTSLKPGDYLHVNSSNVIEKVINNVMEYEDRTGSGAVHFDTNDDQTITGIATATVEKPKEYPIIVLLSQSLVTNLVDIRIGAEERVFWKYTIGILSNKTEIPITTLDGDYISTRFIKITR